MHVYVMELLVAQTLEKDCRALWSCSSSYCLCALVCVPQLSCLSDTIRDNTVTSACLLLGSHAKFHEKCLAQNKCLGFSWLCKDAKPRSTQTRKERNVCESKRKRESRFKETCSWAKSSWLWEETEYILRTVEKGPTRPANWQLHSEILTWALMGMSVSTV